MFLVNIANSVKIKYVCIRNCTLYIKKTCWVERSEKIKTGEKMPKPQVEEIMD